MTLYLTYRPQSFADVVGQDHIVTTLENAVEQDRLAHAYLLSGPRGTGKTSIARILAKHILTAKVADETLRHQILQEIERGALVDLTEIDAASTRGIDDIRDLIDKIQFPPVVAGAKVYIVDEVHMLTKEAFNALLKTLEEPPPYAYFILATTELHKVPDTIQSRCQRFPFRRVRDEDIIQRLQFIVDQERIKADRAALRLIAAHATGSFRDAISLLDQLQSLPIITPEDVASRTGTTAESVIDDIVAMIASQDAGAIPALVEKLEEQGMPLEKVIHALLTHVRKNLREAVEAKRDPGAYVRMLDTILQGLKDLRLAPVPGLVLESTLLKLVQSETPVITTHDEPREIRREPKKVIRDESPAPPPTAKSAVQEAEPVETKKPGLIEVDDVSFENVRKHWNSVLAGITTPSVRMSLKNGKVQSVENDKIYVAFSSTFHRDKVADTNASRMVEEIIHGIFKRQIRMECILEEERSTMVKSTAPSNLVEAAAEVFGIE